MPHPPSFSRSRAGIHILVLVSGLAALSWEVLWQIKASLALGVSAWGTALALAVTMGGMSAGSLIMGHVLRDKTVRPLRVYGFLEIAVGICGLFLGLLFRGVESIDTWLYGVSPGAAPAVYLLGIAASFGIPAMCLGATLPVIGLAARQYKTSIAALYGLNTIGAACGALIAAFLLIPVFGISGTICTVAAVNIIAGAVAIYLDQGKLKPEKPDKKSAAVNGFSDFTAFLVVFITGFATFVLEVAWFRSLTAAFMSTTDAFAIMLACVLISLGLGAALVPFFKHKRKTPLGLLLAWSGIMILFATPVIERFDMFVFIMAQHPLIVFVQWFFSTLYVIGAPVLLLGVALPWILDDQTTPRKWGMLYGFNAFAAIAGALSAGWLFLPAIGFAKTAWMAALLVAGVGIYLAPPPRRAVLGTLTIAGLLFAVVFESGVGRTRVQGTVHFNSKNQPNKILESYEGPDATVSAVEYENGWRLLYIDGFVATAQAASDQPKESVSYMDWMGHLPMLLHPEPKNALVICFGTGQTSNSVRKENPKSLDIVDINEHVFELADNFVSNEGVLDDKRVSTTVMDGRAYIRRTNKTYDVITLEPMPPTFAGVNALYSREFYQHAREKMNEDGVIAQWLPFHLLPAEASASIARTMQDVFPNTVLWIDPSSTTGILIASKNDDGDLGRSWPGFRRAPTKHSLSEKEIKAALFLNRRDLEKYGAAGRVITDNNQLLAYGKAAHMLRLGRDQNKENFDLIEKATGKMAPRDGIEPPTN